MITSRIKTTTCYLNWATLPLSTLSPKLLKVSLDDLWDLFIMAQIVRFREVLIVKLEIRIWKPNSSTGKSWMQNASDVVHDFRNFTKISNCFGVGNRVVTRDEIFRVRLVADISAFTWISWILLHIKWTEPLGHKKMEVVNSINLSPFIGSAFRERKIPAIWQDANWRKFPEI